jgi:RHS repeat-associated protein
LAAAVRLRPVRQPGDGDRLYSDLRAQLDADAKFNWTRPDSQHLDQSHHQQNRGALRIRRIRQHDEGRPREPERLRHRESPDRVLLLANSGTIPDATYFYDGDGKRIKKVVGAETTIFVYDVGEKLVAEYTLGVTANPSPQTSYITADTLGSTLVTNGAGQVVARHDYLPFGDEIYGLGGRTTAQGFAQPDTTRQRFTGYELDTETGLDFAQARYYGNGLGRFTGADPSMESMILIVPQSWNRYTYCHNNPINLTDPSGLDPTYLWLINRSRVGADGNPYPEWLSVEAGENGEYILPSGYTFFTDFAYQTADNRFCALNRFDGRAVGGLGTMGEAQAQVQNWDAEQNEGVFEQVADVFLDFSKAGNLNTFIALRVPDFIPNGRNSNPAPGPAGTTFLGHKIPTADYTQLELDVPAPYTGGLAGGAFQLTRDRHNQWYFGAGVFGGSPGWNLSNGYLVQKETPSAAEMREILTGWGGGAFVAVPPGYGGGVSYTTAQQTDGSTRYLFIPQLGVGSSGAAVSMTYAWPLRGALK